MSARGEKLVGPLLEAFAASVDRARLGRSLDQLLGDPSGSPAKTSSAVAHRIVLSDILDDAILSARPGETSFPLRMFFGSLGDGLDDETTFALATGLNFYFRAAMDEEAKMHVGLEVSRLYYRFAEERGLERDVVVSLSPLLARLMSTELSRIRLEAIDGARTFDSSVHERAPGSDATSPKIAAPKSFLCRVVSSSVVRAKAQVRT